MRVILHPVSRGALVDRLGVSLVLQSAKSHPFGFKCCISLSVLAVNCLAMTCSLRTDLLAVDSIALV